MAAKKKSSKTGGTARSSAPSIKERVYTVVASVIDGWNASSRGARRRGKEPPKPPTTSELANRIEGLSRKQVSNALRGLKADGLLRAEKVKSSRQLLVFALTGEYMTRDSHRRLRTLDKELRTIVRDHEAGDPAMVRELEQYLDRMLDELPGDVDLERAEVRCQELIDAAREAKLKKEIYAHLGFRPVHPSINTWYTV